MSEKGRPPERSRNRSVVPTARRCDWCCREFKRDIEVYWVAGTAGFDERGEPYTGASTRLLLCHRCAPSFDGMVRRAWNRESDRIAGRNLGDMPDLRLRRQGAQKHRDLEGLPISRDGERSGLAGDEGPDTHDETGSIGNG